MFKIDMHVHSVLGEDSSIKPEALIFLARQAGLDAVCVTEHHSFDLSQPFEDISRETGYPIIRGVEYKAREGHLLVYGVNMGRGDMPPQMPMQHVINWVQNRDGAAIPAHPYQADMFGRFLGNRLSTLKNLLAIETFNGSASTIENQQADEIADKLRTGKIGGSDAHGPNGIGKAFTVFPKPIHTSEELVDALKNENYYPLGRAPGKS